MIFLLWVSKEKRQKEADRPTGYPLNNKQGVAGIFDEKYDWTVLS
jgi:hypothetical protein